MILAVLLFASPIDAWAPVKAPLDTPWTADVHPDQTPEYPRPQMKRSDSSWQHLNGLWEIDYLVEDLSNPPFGKTLPDQILVPYPLESSLSGIRKQAPNNSMFYRREFTSFLDNCTERKLLHIEASDYNTTVWVNGQLVGNHVGGYDPFSFDVTSYLTENGDTEIVVGVFDATESNRMDQSYGKQCRACFDKPSGMNYSPSSGIWATVWAECVPTNYIQDIYLQPDIDAKSLTVTVDANGPEFARSGMRMGEDAHAVVVSMLDAEGRHVASARSTAPVLTVLLQVPDAALQLWTPDSPYLYGLEITLESGAGVAIDAVSSYVGMRKVGIGKAKLSGTADAVPMVLVNNDVLFQLGTLDQGWFPDGLYAAPTDKALEFDLRMTKAMGFNNVRKHMKVETRRWFHKCDTMGLLVWQDMPAPWYEDQHTWHQQIAAHWKAHRNSPAVVMWELINEGWGPNDLEGTSAAVAVLQSLERDARIIDDASGGRGWGCNYTIVPQRMQCPSTVCNMFWTGGCTKVSNVTDHHHYPNPELPLAYSVGSTGAAQPRLLGEYGGFGLRVDNNTWAAREVCNFAIGTTSYTPLLHAVGEGNGSSLQPVASQYLMHLRGQSAAVRLDPRWRGDAYHREATDSAVAKAREWRHTMPTNGSGAIGAYSFKMLNDTGFTEQLESFQRAIGGDGGLFAKGGLGSAIWTQISDIECELNGFFTYDRRVYKPNLERVAAVNRELLANTTAHVEYVLVH
jgi:hypothetical protein